MGSAPKPQGICWKWPWETLSAAQNLNGISPCDSSEPPLLLKSLHNLGSFLAANLFGGGGGGGAAPGKATLRTQNGSLRVEPHGGGGGGGSRGQPLSKEEQGEAEQRAFAAALASGKESTVLEFYSPRCRLCSSLLDLVLEVERRNTDWVSFALADAENDKWLPEVSPPNPEIESFFFPFLSTMKKLATSLTGAMRSYVSHLLW